MKKLIFLFLVVSSTNAWTQFSRSASTSEIAQIANDSSNTWLRTNSVVGLANNGDSVFVGKIGVGITPTTRMFSMLIPDNTGGIYAETLENGGSSTPFEARASIANFNGFLWTLSLNSATNGSFVRYLRIPSTTVYTVNSAGVHSSLGVTSIPTPATNLASFYAYDPGGGTSEFGAGREGDAVFYPVTVVIDNSFVTIATTDTTTYTGATTNSRWSFCGYRQATASTDIIVFVEPVTDGVVVHRIAGTTSGAAYTVKLEKL